jgi:hypothetical protein
MYRRSCRPWSPRASERVSARLEIVNKSHTAWQGPAPASMW